MCTQFLETVTGKKIWEPLFENVFSECSSTSSSNHCCCLLLLLFFVTYKFPGFHCSVVEDSVLVDVPLCHWLISDLTFEETVETLKHQEIIFQ
jgi:hypothetical protein